MHRQSLNTLNRLRAKVQEMIPDTATESNIWTYLNWDEACSRHYSAAKALGIDLRQVMAPVFSDVVSLLCDDVCLSKETCWPDVLAGDALRFAGENPKERVLAVIDYFIKQRHLRRLA